MTSMIKCPICGGSGEIPEESVSFGMRLKAGRQRLGLTQAEMAPRLAVGRAQLANLESDRSQPSMPVLIKAVVALGVSSGYLLGIK